MSEAAEVTEANKIPGALLGSGLKNGDLYIWVAREHLLEVLTALRDHSELRYSYFSECVGIDYSAWPHPRDLKERFEVVYNLMSPDRGARVFVKIGVDDGDTVPTAKHVYAGAEYPEREIQDLFGVIFAGNGPTPGERFLLPDEWSGYPLRKEFPLGGEDVVFAHGTAGPAVEDLATPRAGESFDGKSAGRDSDRRG